MLFYKKIIILFIVLLFTYILYRLFLRRRELIKREGLLFDKTEESEITNSKDTTTSPGLFTIDNAYLGMPLSQFVIKGSFNSAITGNFVSLDMLKYVLSRGCRFIDFEVFNIDGKAYVSYSHDAKFSMIETDNKLLLDNVLSSAVANAFNSPSPNSKDPLFIQLRVKSNDNAIYNMVAKAINNTLVPRLYQGKITNKTKLSDVMGKVVLIMDKTINYNYATATNCNVNDKTCYDITKFINAESGTEFIRTNNFSTILNKRINPPEINDNNITSNVQIIQIAYPDIDNDILSNPMPEQLITNYGCQVLLYRFYNKDAGLEDYEEIFRENKYGMVPMVNMLIYLKKRDK